MGDAADANIENGQDELAAHQAGDCEFGCPYCEQAPRPEIPQEWYTDPRCELDDHGQVARHRPRCKCGWRPTTTIQRTVTLWVDGGVFGRNPSPRGVYWSVAIEGVAEIIRKQDRTLKFKTNNDAEWLALREALLWANTHLPGKSLVINSDSRHVVDCFTGRKRLKEPRLAPLYWACKHAAVKHAMVVVQWCSRDVMVEKLGH